MSENEGAHNDQLDLDDLDSVAGGFALAGRAESDASEALGKLLRKRCISSLRRDFPRIPAS